MTASKVEALLDGKKFVGGDKPSAEDVKLFNELLGEKNSSLHRWVKHMASFTEVERGAWKAAKPAENKITCSVSGNVKASKKAEKDKPAPVVKKAARTSVVANISLKAGTCPKETESLIRMIKVDGLEFGTFVAAKDSLKWTCVIDDLKVSKQDLLDMTVGFTGLVTKTDFAEWKSL
eukprot:TRINITY_DN651_c5_g1_i1.p1 TRINITY_DN651_c5_g1~~TRINITY_DN651_c5_g1_i1.p1  ORF type:complete len:192 (+),score=66.05 TRINITY_DN651_c5_g1_i1:48-578(+)